MRVTDSGLAIFGYQPGATLQAPPPRLGPGLAAPAAHDDIQRLVTSHTIDTPVSVLDDLRANGKYAQRIWKVENVGSGLPTPEGIKVLEQIKADRRWVPSAEQLAAAERAYNEFTGLTAGRTS